MERIDPLDIILCSRNLYANSRYIEVFTFREAESMRLFGLCATVTSIEDPLIIFILDLDWSLLVEADPASMEDSSG